MNAEQFQLFIRNAPAKSARDLVKFLGQQVESIESLTLDRCPLLTVSTNNGHQFVGRLVRWQEDTEQRSSHFILGGVTQNGLVPHDLIYVSTNDVVVCIVHSIESEVSRLTFGNRSNREHEVAPSRLQLKKLVSEFQPLLTIDWNTVSDSATHLLNLNDYIVSLIATMHEIARDKIGQESIRVLKEIKMITGNNKDISCAMANGILSLTINLDRSLPSNLAKSLKGEIEKCL